MSPRACNSSMASVALGMLTVRTPQSSEVRSAGVRVLGPGEAALPYLEPPLVPAP